MTDQQQADAIVRNYQARKRKELAEIARRRRHTCSYCRQQTTGGRYCSPGCEAEHARAMDQWFRQRRREQQEKNRRERAR
ncbi:hypothetical protein GCM10023116_31170 [Kistimonas scapharcae]|uniref:Uncharacterized protein n=1 Tax=Kistimonas scapharcae TaxID=1036133 RepID=A0ABP8V605_9GAMM